MHRINRLLIVVFASACFTSAMHEQASAQYPVAVVPAVAPVGYAAERRGLFGRRVVMRPVYAPVAAAVPMAVAAPVTVARPVIASPTVTVGYAPVAPAAPVRAYYAPAAPVRAYYAPAAPVRAYYAPVRAYYAPVAPVTTYRVPVPVTTYRVPVAVPVRTYSPPMIHF